MPPRSHFHLDREPDGGRVARFENWPSPQRFASGWYRFSQSGSHAGHRRFTGKGSVRPERTVHVRNIATRTAASWARRQWLACFVSLGERTNHHTPWLWRRGTKRAHDRRGQIAPLCNVSVGPSANRCAPIRSRYRGCTGRLALVISLKSRSPAALARRHARRERWRQPLTTPQDRREAWASLLWSDHGLFRIVKKNRHQVTPELWRSAQPAPADIRWARRQGIRTVLSFRHDGFAGDLLEREACDAEGLAFARLPLYSRGAPPVETLRQALTLLPTLERPVLMHCKSGADRAGLGAALWRIIVDGASARAAGEQLSLRYGHIARSKTGVLDAFIAAWAATGEAEGISFGEWIETIYDPDALQAEFRPAWWASGAVVVLRRE